MLHGCDKAHFMPCPMRQEFHPAFQRSLVEGKCIEESLAQHRSFPAKARKEVERGQRRHVAVQPQVARNETDVETARGLGRRLAKQEDAAARGAHQSEDDAQWRRLAGAARSQVTEERKS